MAIGSHQLFLMAADLTVASVLSFVLYVLGCLFLASLSSLVIFHFSFGLLKRAKRRAKRKISLKGRAILSLVSRSTIGGMLVKRLGQEGSGLLEVNRSSEEEKSPMLKKESSSNTRVRQLPAGMSGVLKNPAVTFQEEEAETRNDYEGTSSPKQKNGILTPAFFIALIWLPVKIACPCLRKRGCLRRVCTFVWGKTTRFALGLSEKN
ncbi:uncharacterized protein LOC118082492 isoform X1 [Zootoca vivipara]|uniref:uncharacterized protein LOC118082492 isoform X1 n=1 Tax=Zootoca vivipara TaxID=8524 RepID=UPI00293BB999|nr:uncharacterized protein LOC118082492 isoform X1 [Zootoca vivipara]